MAGFFGRTLDRLSVDRQDAADLQQGARLAGCAPIAEQTEREPASVHGVLRRVTLQPHEGCSSLEAELFDGTGQVTLIWLGQRTISGIAVGRRLTAHGRIGRRGADKVLYNPRYELES